MISEHIQNAEIIVIKVGSSLLIENGQLNQTWLSALAADLVDARARGQKVIIVSSGAVALGSNSLGLAREELTLEQSQAVAATGQIDWPMAGKKPSPRWAVRQRKFYLP